MADERRYYVICDDNCKFPSMTEEQILEAIAEATGNTPEHVDDAFITKIKEQNKQGTLKFWRGTTAEYNAIPVKANDVFYILSDDHSKEEMQEDIYEMQNEQTSMSATLGGVSSSVITLRNEHDALANSVSPKPFSITAIPSSWSGGYTPSTIDYQTCKYFPAFKIAFIKAKITINAQISGESVIAQIPPSFVGSTVCALTCIHDEPSQGTMRTIKSSDAAWAYDEEIHVGRSNGFVAGSSFYITGFWFLN